MLSAPLPVEKADSPRMFDRIAGTYDTVNRVLSLGIDVLWRRRVVRAIPAGARQLLDVATGTGDLALALARHHPEAEVVGVDLSEGMLAVGREKVASSDVALRITLLRGDAQDLPVAEGSFDASTIAFGIRNVPDTILALSQMCRALRPGGRVHVLEFSLPTNPVIRAGHLFYMRHVLPRIGGWISGDVDAYRYLNQTIEAFPYGPAFLALMDRAGLVRCQAHPLSFGIATLYVGERP